MSKRIIIDKLESFLEKHLKFNEECEVTYLLAETRKIIEDEKEKYKTLYFYCCWTLHSKLNYNPTAEFLSEKFDKFIDFNKSKREIQRDLVKGQEDFFKLKDLNIELKKFLKNNELFSNIFKGNGWNKFCKLFLENIMECKIDFGVKAKYCKISRFSVEKSSQGYYYLFYLSNGMRIPRIELTFKQKK